MYTHNAHPCFEWYIPSKSPILRELLNVESGNMNGGFSSVFGRLMHPSKETLNSPSSRVDADSTSRRRRILRCIFSGVRES